MKLLIFVSIVALFAFAVKASEKARFDNYRVYKISIENDEQLQLLKQIERFPDGVRENNQIKFASLIVLLAVSLLGPSSGKGKAC